jgi:circadian clock protein KaiB
MLSHQLKKEVEIKVRSKPGEKPYLLHLFIANHTPSSVMAMANLDQICHERLADRCRIEIVDIRTDPDQAIKENIVAVPTLVKKEPLPEKRVIGNLIDTDRVLLGLGLV